MVDMLAVRKKVAEDKARRTTVSDNRQSGLYVMKTPTSHRVTEEDDVNMPPNDITAAEEEKALSHNLE